MVTATYMLGLSTLMIIIFSIAYYLEQKIKANNGSN